MRTAHPLLRRSIRWPDSPPRPERLVETIRRLASEGKIVFTYHALSERMPERGFDVADVKKILLNGNVAGDIEAGKNSGDWKVKIVDEIDGTGRKAGAVTIVRQDKRILILTVEWEDR